jgi:hypothetical protein
MAGRYYRAGHWVNRPTQTAPRKVNPLVWLIVIGLALLASWLGLFAPSSQSGQGAANQSPSVSGSPTAGQQH